MQPQHITSTGSNGELPHPKRTSISLQARFAKILYKLSASLSRENPIANIKYYLLAGYIVLCLALAWQSSASLVSTYVSIFMILVTFFVSDLGTKGVLYYAPILFIITTLLLDNSELYLRRFKLYLPQFLLLIRNNLYFSILLEIIIILHCLLSASCGTDGFDILNSIYMLAILTLIVKTVHAKSLEVEQLRAQGDSMKQHLETYEAKMHETQQFTKNFLLSVSHEFRNPLNNVMGNLELIQKSVPENDEIQQLSKTARFGCEILLNLVNNMLDASKLESDEMDIHYVSTSVRKFFEKSWALFSEIIKAKGLEAELYLHRYTPPFLMLDTARVQQILLNLVDNAAKFTPKGFVKIIVSWHPVRLPERKGSDHLVPPLSEFGSRSSTQIGSFHHLPVTKRESDPFDDTTVVNEDTFEFPIQGNYKINFSPSMNYLKLDLKKKKFSKTDSKLNVPDIIEGTDGYLKVQVIDSGVGIPHDKARKIFHKFSKITTDGQRKEGSGLGLWISRQLCRKMEGEIAVQSELNKGATFTIFIKAEISPQSMTTPSPCHSRPTMQLRGSFLKSVDEYSNKSSFSERVEEATKPVPAKEEEQQHLRAMVVDDIAYNQQLNKQFLELSKVEVCYIAGDGLEAYNYYIKAKPGYIDLIFMDLDMPVMDGKTSCAKIREFEKANKRTPVIIVILTGNCTEHELKECLDKKGAIRADYFYRKPMPLSDCQNLIQLIRRQKSKKKKMLISLPGLSDQVIVYEKDIFQRVSIENYLRIAQVKYMMLQKEDIFKELVRNSESIKAVVYDCLDGEEEAIEVGKKLKQLLSSKNASRIVLVAMIGEGQNEEISEKLKKAGWNEILVKPVAYDKLILAIKG